MESELKVGSKEIRKKKNSSVKSNKRKGRERGKEQIKSLSGETSVNTSKGLQRSRR